MKAKFATAPMALALLLSACSGDSASSSVDAHGHEETEHQNESHDEDGHEAEEGVINLTDAQIQQAKIAIIAVSQAGSGGSLALPATLEADPQGIQVVTASIGGRIVALRRNLGETVRAGEPLAILESREAAQIQGEIEAASARLALARSNVAREERLFAQRVSPEQDLLAARTAAAEAAIALRLARQQLAATGQAGGNFNRVLLPSPISGQVIARSALLGQQVAADTELYRVSNLSQLSVVISLSAKDARSVRSGAQITLNAPGRTGTAVVRFVSPILDPQTRLVSVIASLDNRLGQWRIGETVTASIPLDAADGGQAIAVPQIAIQTVDGKPSVFVRTSTGFRSVAVETGAARGSDILVLKGLRGGERIASTGSFILKAELGKGEAEHGH